MIGFLRSLLALWLGKIAIFVIRKLGRKGGTNWPGKLALRIDPKLLQRRGRLNQHGNIIVTGTNGKTTTSHILAGMLQLAGFRVIHNRSGANLYYGLTAAMIEGARWTGRGADFGVLEVDEATVPAAAQAVHPRMFVVTNLFRDQIDRFQSPEHTLEFIQRGVPHVQAGGTLILNADDPLVTSIIPPDNGNIVYFGVDRFDVHRETTYVGPRNESDLCRICREPYTYSMRTLGHLGHYFCTRCRIRRPDPHVALIYYEAPERERAGRLSIRLPDGNLDVPWNPVGFYNVYNALAAVATAWTLNIPQTVIEQGLIRFRSGFGRMEQVNVDGVPAVLALVKNAVGFQQAMQTALVDRHTHKVLLIVINDYSADGTDVSWLWDVPFEHIVRKDEISLVVAAGTRAVDVALRLGEAGVPEERVRTVGDVSEALDAAARSASDSGIIYAFTSYTAMLQIRETLHKRGIVQPFWQT